MEEAVSGAASTASPAAVSWERSCERGRRFRVAPAESLGAALLTLDRRLARARGLECEVEVVSWG